MRTSVVELVSSRRFRMAARFAGDAAGDILRKGRGVDALGGRPDEYEVVVDAGAGEVGVFSQKP